MLCRLKGLLAVGRRPHLWLVQQTFRPVCDANGFPNPLILLEKWWQCYCARMNTLSSRPFCDFEASPAAIMKAYIADGDGIHRSPSLGWDFYGIWWKSLHVIFGRHHCSLSARNSAWEVRFQPDVVGQYFPVSESNKKFLVYVGNRADIVKALKLGFLCQFLGVSYYKCGVWQQNFVVTKIWR